MVSTTVLRFLLILFVSFLFGYLFYYVLDPAKKATKKKRIDDVTSILLNVVIFIWIGKIIVNLQVFMRDPFAILAYPSDRRALYIALIFGTIHILYRSIWKKQAFRSTWETIVPVLIGTLFMYELLQFFVENHTYYFSYIIMYTILLILYVVTQENPYQIPIVLYSWLMMLLISWWSLDSVRLFQYMISPLFIGVVFIFYSIFFIKELKFSEG